MTAVLAGTTGTRHGGVPARQAVVRWAWRLSRREWRQQLLVLAMLTVAVAATILGAGIATNTPPANPNAATFGTASAMVTLPGADAADIAAITQRRHKARARARAQVRASHKHSSRPCRACRGTRRSPTRA